jgi:hypothetical protein
MLPYPHPVPAIAVVPPGLELRIPRRGLRIMNMKKAVMLDKNDKVTQDPEQAVRVIVAEYNDRGSLIKETIYFKEEETNDNDTAKAKE